MSSTNSQSDSNNSQDSENKSSPKSSSSSGQPFERLSPEEKTSILRAVKQVQDHQAAAGIDDSGGPNRDYE